MKWTFRRALLLLAAALTLAACGSMASTNPSTTNPHASTTSAPRASSTTTTTVSTTTTTSTGGVLPPATTPPVVSECSIQLAFAADGNASPLFCTDGGINVVAWNYFAGSYPQILSLGPNATPTQVQQAMCAAMAHGTGPTVQSAGQLAERYYGWHFAVDPVTNFIPGNC